MVGAALTWLGPRPTTERCCLEIFCQALHFVVSFLQTLNQLQKSHKRVSKIGIDQEETLLRETASREAELLQDINTLQLELRNARNAIEGLESEAGRCRTLVTELQSSVDMLEAQNRKLKRDKKEMKARETKNMSDYAELEDENVGLHKQLLHLKQTLVEYESLKQENSHLRSSVDDLRSERDELARLKKAIEASVEELLEQLHIEREQKLSLKNELEQHLSKVSMYSLQAGFGLDGLDCRLGALDDGEFEQDDGDNPSLIRIEADLLMSSESKNSSGIAGDLFSEIHVSQVRKLEDQLDEMEVQKSELEKLLSDCQKQLESAMAELQNHSNHSDEEKLKSLASITEGVLRDELALVRDQVSEYERTIEELRANSGQLSPSALRERLLQLSKDLAQVLYLAGSATVVKTKNKEDENTGAGSPLDERANSTSPSVANSLTDSEGRTSEKLLQIVCVQVKDIENVIKSLLKTHVLSRSSSNSSDDAIELCEEIAKLKALVSAKNEKIAMLRCIIKENKATATSALAALKDRYQEERTVVSETQLRLRNELTSLKEDATEFTTLRASLSQRCDEYLAQVMEKTNQLSSMEEEKKYLNSLLRSAIQQKITLTQRLEDVEFDVERRNLERQFAAKKNQKVAKASFIATLYTCLLITYSHTLHTHAYVCTTHAYVCTSHAYICTIIRTIGTYICLYAHRYLQAYASSDSSSYIACRLIFFYFLT